MCFEDQNKQIPSHGVCINTPWKIRFPSQTPESCCFTVYVLSLSLLKPWRNTPCRVDVWALFAWGVRLCWKPCFSRAVPQSSRRGGLLSYSLQCESSKTFPSLLCFLIISRDTWVHWSSRTLSRTGDPHTLLLPPSPLSRLNSPQPAPDLRHSIVGDPQAQLDPNQEKGSLQSLMWIQATKVLNNCHVCSQPCTKGWNRIPRSLFSGKTEHQGRKGKHVERGQKHYVSQKEKIRSWRGGMSELARG